MTTCKDTSYRQMRLQLDEDELEPITEPSFRPSSPEECGRTIIQYNKMRGWGFNPFEIMHVVNEMTNYPYLHNPLQIIFARIDLGLSLAETWTELSTCIKIGLKQMECEFRDRIDIQNLKYLPGRERESEQESARKLSRVGIDLSSHLGANRIGITIAPGDFWPGIEVLSMILQNLELYVAMDGINIPYISAPGLDVQTKSPKGSIRHSMPCFHCIDGKRASIILDSHNRDDRNRDVTALASFLWINGRVLD